MVPSVCLSSILTAEPFDVRTQNLVEGLTLINIGSHGQGTALFYKAAKTAKAAYADRPAKAAYADRWPPYQLCRLLETLAALAQKMNNTKKLPPLWGQWGSLAI